MSGPELFVVCKTCGSEVSPYITECPYCGNRLRKRAPKLGRDGQLETPRPKRRPRAPALGRIRPGEIPGIRADGRPYGTLALLGVSLILEATWRLGGVDFFKLVVAESIGSDPWRPLTAPLVYGAAGYQVACFAAIALFGWLLERRIGPIPVILLFLAAGAGGMALAVGVQRDAYAVGGNGAALGLLAAWALPDTLRRRAGDETDSDLLGVAAIAIVLLALPLVVSEADWISGVGGAVIGAIGGLGLQRSAR